MTPGSIMSPVWTMDNIIEKRSDSDRASIYSRSSGSASEYSVPRSALHLDKSFDSKRESPVACCTPTVPVKTGFSCQCWQQPKPCCCRKKTFSGPYENYDVPKTPMPLIQVRITLLLNFCTNLNFISVKYPYCIMIYDTDNILYLTKHQYKDQ